MAELIAAVTAAGNAATRIAADATMPPEIRTHLAQFSDRLAQDEAELIIHLATMARAVVTPEPPTPDAAT